MEIRKKKLPFTFEILKVQIKRKGIFTSLSFKRKSIKKKYFLSSFEAVLSQISIKKKC